MKLHSWNEIIDVNIMGEDGKIDLPVNHCHHLDVNFVGENIDNYDSMLVLTHFKGHPTVSFGETLRIFQLVLLHHMVKLIFMI